MLKKLLRPYIPSYILERRKRKWVRAQLEQWHYNGCLLPAPHIVKQITIAYYQKKFSISSFVETGTYLGDMIEAQKKRFKKLYTIELGIDLYKKAAERFANDNNIQIIQGDSGQVLPSLLKEINESAIFWLDGHYSEGITAKGNKNCPIFEEIDAILNNSKYNHVLLIDDARCFIGEGDYPTIENLATYIKSKNAKYQFEVKNDIIHFVIK